MSEKNMGRKFKVGDKVKLTKEGKYSDYFHADFNVGDTAEIVSMNEILVTSGRIEGQPQFIAIEFMSEGWISHLSKKKVKKKRKHFRMGDLVVLKDKVNISEVAIYNNIQKGVVAMISSEEYNGVLRVHFFTKEGYESDRVKIGALRLATKKERKSFRKYKVAKIVCDNVSENEQDTEIVTREIPPEYDVKVGDIVEVTEDVGGYLVGTIGQVDTVNEDIVGCYNHVVVCGTDGDCWSERNVKLLYRQNMNVCSALNYNVKVGDIIEVTEDVLGHSVGKLGEVTELLRPKNPTTQNIVAVTGFSGETHIERNVRLVYRKPEIKSK